MNTVSSELMVYDEVLPGGNHWSLVVRRGFTLRLTDLEGGANVGALFYNNEEKTERYNMPDTLKCQHTAHLTRGHCLYSDMGRILVSIPEDSCGWHDPLCGTTNARTVESRYGRRDYQEYRNAYLRNGRDSFLMQLGRHALGRRDLTANVNFFSKVTVDDDGRLRFHPQNSLAESYVDLRAEMNVLVVLNSCPHPLDSAGEYPLRPVRMQVWRSGPGGGPEDPCRLSRPENERGFQNTLAYFAQREAGP